MKASTHFNLVIGNDTCGTCTGLTLDGPQAIISVFNDIKTHGRLSEHLKPFHNDNMAGISFCSDEPIDISIDADDEEGYPLDGNAFDVIMKPIIAAGYESISI